MIPNSLRNKLARDVELLLKINYRVIQAWDDDLKERRLTFDEIGKLIHAGKEDIEIILSPNTKTYWLYSNTLDAYCEMVYKGWKQEKEFIQKLVDNGGYLYPLMRWTFGNIDL